MKKIERLSLIFELGDSDYVNDYMKDHECPEITMIDAIYLNGQRFYEWKMREWSCWDYTEIKLTKEEKLSQLVHAMKIIYTISSRIESMDDLDWEFNKMLRELASELATEYVCVNECFDDLYYEEDELKEIMGVK